MGGKELTLYCVDVSPSMAEERTVDDIVAGKMKSASNLEYGLEFVRNQVANMLLSGLKTVHCGIVLFGSDCTKNSLADKGYEFIWEYVSPNQPTAITLTRIDEIKKHLTQSEQPFKGDLLSAIILCNHLMGETIGAKKWCRKLVVVTDAQTETDWNGWKDQRNQMRLDDVKLTVVGLDFDDLDLGYKQPNKSEIKAHNEKQLHLLCQGLGNGSSCSTALLAVMNAQSPTPRVVGSNPSQITLSIGFPETDKATAQGYDPEETLLVHCQLQKCTTIIRPMASKKMSRSGVQGELNRRRKDLAHVQSSKVLEHHLAAEGENFDEVTGLIQINRRHVYVNKLENDSDDPDVQESSGDEPAPVEYREADQNNLQKAYNYGASRVLIDKEDEQEIRQSFSASLQIRGFLSLNSVPRHHLMNNVYYLSASNQDSCSQITFSAIVRAMSAGNKAALARYVSKSLTAEPKLVILIPVIEPKIRYFLFIQVPFAEDIREYYFPPLASVTDSLNRRVNVQHIPTEEMQGAMDDFVDRMDLSAEENELTLEGGRTEPWLLIEDTCSPAVHHMKNCVVHDLSHPGSEDLPKVHPALSKCFAPPQHVVQRAATSLNLVKQLFDIKIAPSKPTKRQKYAPLTGTTTEDHGEKIDLDDILGDGDLDNETKLKTQS